jgi:hypothetical protein
VRIAEEQRRRWATRRAHLLLAYFFQAQDGGPESTKKAGAHRWAKEARVTSVPRVV